MFDWRYVHGMLVGIAARRAALDADEAKWLREADRLQIWRRFGMVGALDYMERELGYAPHSARERLRVARALAELRGVEAALARGALCFSVVKELSRVAVADTEREWLDAVAGKSLQLVEELVAGKRRGDRPDDPARPGARRRKLTLELSADVYARLREVRARLCDDDGHRLDDDGLVRALCDAVEAGGEPGAARYQIAIQRCPSCDRAWQDGGGARIEIDAATLERAECDAQHVGSLDARVPERATQAIPPAVVRFIWRRDHGRCRVPGCRSARGLEIHHLVAREEGGGHDPDNLILTCGSCHQAHHRGELRLAGTAKNVEIVRPMAEVVASTSRAGQVASPAGSPVSRVGPDARDVRVALVNLGFAPRVAGEAVDAARQRVPATAPIEHLVRAALQTLVPPGVVRVAPS